MTVRQHKTRKKKPETVPCDPCQGTGLVKSTLQPYGVTPCHVCKGEGVLPVYQGSPQPSSRNGVA